MRPVLSDIQNIIVTSSIAFFTGHVFKIFGPAMALVNKQGLGNGIAMVPSTSEAYLRCNIAAQASPCLAKVLSSTYGPWLILMQHHYPLMAFTETAASQLLSFILNR